MVIPGYIGQWEQYRQSSVHDEPSKVLQVPHMHAYIPQMSCGSSNAWQMNQCNEGINTANLAMYQHLSYNHATSLH